MEADRGSPYLGFRWGPRWVGKGWDISPESGKGEVREAGDQPCCSITGTGAGGPGVWHRILGIAPRLWKGTATGWTVLVGLCCEDPERKVGFNCTVNKNKYILKFLEGEKKVQRVNFFQLSFL